MTLQQIRYVLAVADCGSLNRAAEGLYITQPSLTSAVRELESELGIQLFLRSNKGVVQTTEGAEFIARARRLYQQYELLEEQYRAPERKKLRFGVSTQHYAFAIRAFADTVRAVDAEDYDFVIRESRTADVIRDVTEQRCEIGVLYISRDNRKVLRKMLDAQELEFHELAASPPHVLLRREHPLAERKSLTREDLAEYPCLTFEQGDDSSDFFAEEVIRIMESDRLIRTTDRATMQDLMGELQAYTIGSGLLRTTGDGSRFRAIPLEEGDEAEKNRMHIGYVVNKNRVLSATGQVYVRHLRGVLAEKGIKV